MKILIISNNFPDKLHPNKYVFLKKTSDGLNKNGNDIRMIAPSPFYYKTKEINKYSDRIVRPLLLSIFARSNYFSRFLSKINYFFLKHAIFNGFKHLNFKPDIIYSHFIKCAVCSIPLAKKMKIPLVVGLGESSFRKFELENSIKLIKKRLNNINYFISVSNGTKEKFIQDYKVPNKKISVYPNAVPEFFFKNYDKIKLKNKYNFPLNYFIVSFLGFFVERKGPLRVLKAIEELENVYGIFIGDGVQKPKGNKVLFNNKVDYELVPEILSCSDVFVFPTYFEGSSNAIIEAMALGLPIIASDIESIKEQTKKNFSILINPHDVSEIKSKIVYLLNNEQTRKNMGKEARKEAINYKLDNRILNIQAVFNKLVYNS